MTRPSRRKNRDSGCTPPCKPEQSRRLGSLQDIVRRYREKDAPKAEKVYAHYRKASDIRDAIQKASVAEMPNGKKHPHQHRLPRRVFPQVKKRLLRISEDLKRCESFEDLHEKVKNCIGGIRGVGDLMVYDTATRIGAFRGLSPQYVYLHAGTREGARALGIGGKERIHPQELPVELRRLRPDQIEDLLCIYKEALEDLANNGQAVSRDAMQTQA